MPKIICTIPEASLDRAQIRTAETALRAIYAQQFGDVHKIMVLWTRLPAGQSYVAGKQGDVFIALVEVANGLTDDVRADAMLAFNQAFADAVGVPHDKPLVSMMDTAKVNEYLAANRRRLRWRSRIAFVASTLIHALRSRKRDGFASIRPNL